MNDALQSCKIARSDASGRLAGLRWAAVAVLPRSSRHVMPPRKNPFPPEADTKPDLHSPKAAPRRPVESAPAPKAKRERSEAPTLPPPAGKPRKRRTSAAPRESDVRPVSDRMPAATVDEVTADLSNDPRRERDDDEDDGAK